MLRPPRHETTGLVWLGPLPSSHTAMLLHTLSRPSLALTHSVSSGPKQGLICATLTTFDICLGNARYPSADMPPAAHGRRIKARPSPPLSLYSLDMHTATVSAQVDAI